MIKNFYRCFHPASLLPLTTCHHSLLDVNLWNKFVYSYFLLPRQLILQLTVFRKPFSFDKFCNCKSTVVKANWRHGCPSKIFFCDKRIFRDRDKKTRNSWLKSTQERAGKLDKNAQNTILWKKSFVHTTSRW